MRRNNKKGFTLAEVLIAMALVGILSALVMPQLVKSVQKDRAGMLLGKAVEQIELGCQNMIQAFNERMENEGRASMTDTLLGMDGEFRLEEFNLFVGAKNIEAGGLTAIRFTKFPVDVLIIPFGMPVNITRDTIIHRIVIDVNGLQNRPNMAGRDRFQFELRNDGKLVPAGLGLHTCDGDNPEQINANCTARVIKDGFKIKYNW